MLAYFLPEGPSEIFQIFDEVSGHFFMGGGGCGKQNEIERGKRGRLFCINIHCKLEKCE